MVTALRKTGIDIMGDMPWGTHFCHFHETKQDLLDTSVPYFKAGLEDNEFCLWVISRLLTEEDAKSALRHAVPDLDHYLAEQSIEVLPHDEWYLQGGVFDFHRVLNGWHEKLDQALARGYTGMRVIGCTAWLEKKDWRDFRDYETELNESIANRRMIISCAYPLAASSAAEVLDVARIHQFTVARRKGEWEVIETPELKQAKAEIKRLNEELEQRVVERTSALAVINEALKQEITERKRTEEMQRVTSEQLRARSASLRSAREEEGARIARELHDELGSALTGLKWELESMGKLCSEADNPLASSPLQEKITGMRELIEATLTTVKRLSSELRPGILDDLGLVAALEWQAQQFLTARSRHYRTQAGRGRARVLCCAL